LSEAEKVSRRGYVKYVGGIVVVAVVAAAGYGIYEATKPPVKPPEENKLTIYHWWTAGGERQAIDALYAVYKNDNPGVEIFDSPAAGGGGGIMRAAVKTMLMAGQPPDTFQITYGPGMVTSWSTYLEPIDDLFTDFPIPETLKNWGKGWGGQHYYCMPLNIHRSSNIWYNMKLVNKLGIKMPIETVDAFFEACKVAKAGGLTPFAFGTGGGQRFWLNYLLEWFMLAAPSGGADYVNSFNAGTAHPATDPAVRTALENLENLWKNYVNSDFGALTWDEAGKVLMRDEGVFHYMGDWQKGAFVAAGWKPDVDFGHQPAPGTAGASIAHGDSFALVKNAPHPTAVRKFLQTLKSAKGEEAFCVIKGASPPRSDTPLDRFDPMQRRIIQLIRTDKLVVGGHGVVEAWMDKGGEILETFVTKFDIDAAIASIDAAHKEIYATIHG